MTQKPETISLYQFFQRFPNEEAARGYFETNRWNGEVSCPHCGSLSVAAVKSMKPMPYRCRDCRQHFSVRTGTVLAESRLPLHKWLMAIYMMTTARKGIPSTQMARELGITQKSAWFLAQRIRETMTGANGSGPLGGINKVVEADETYVGGKAKNRAFRDPAPKKAVVALVERDGHVRSFHVANVTGKQLRPILTQHIHSASHLMTDESPVYTGVGKTFAGHTTVIHSRGEYVRKAGFAHSNTAENFFSIFKRGVIGTYHHMSEAHLHRYTAEFDFRYNTRSDSDAERADVALVGIAGKRLTYRRPHASATA